MISEVSNITGFGLFWGYFLIKNAWLATGAILFNSAAGSAPAPAVWFLSYFKCDKILGVLTGLLADDMIDPRPTDWISLSKPACD